MYEWFLALPEIFQPINLLDITIIAIVIYKLTMMLKDTRAEQLVKGIVILLGASVISEYIGLTAVNWILIQLQKMLVIAIPILFAPELRKVLANLGQRRFLSNFFKKQNNSFSNELIESLMGTMIDNSATNTGVLIAVEREDSLLEYISTGIQINAVISTALLNNIFVVNTPLHDGAVILRNGKIEAAACYLPLSESRGISKALGTRHRAAIGLTEQTDAVVLIVSEETGAMSIAQNGKLFHDLSRKDLYALLIENFRPIVASPERKFGKWRFFND